MEENGRLSNLGLTEFLIGSSKHNVGDVETEDVICLIEKLARLSVVLVKVFAHARELRALARENVCFHLLNTLSVFDRTKVMIFRTYTTALPSLLIFTTFENTFKFIY